MPLTAAICGMWLLLAGMAAALAASPPPGSPVALHGKLHVCGTQICDANNNPIQLRGMSTQGLQWYRQCLTKESLDALAYDWKIDVLRISMYVQEGGYETNPVFFTNWVNHLIDQATKRGVYAIVDWHILNPGDPYYNFDLAKAFFTEIATRHKDKINIIYEVANEPHGVSWERIKAYHEEIIPVIRAIDPDTIILLGTRGYSSFGLNEGFDETEIINNPVNADNVMYTFHFYAASHREPFRNALSRAADQIPVFVSEFGTQTFTGDGPNDWPESRKYIDLMASKKISWANWNYSDHDNTGAVLIPGTCPGGQYAGRTSLKESGRWVRRRIREFR